MSSTKISRAKAEATLKAITQQFAVYTTNSDGVPNQPYDLPVLVEEDDRWLISWESGSPDEWAYRAFEGGIDEEMTVMVREFSPKAVVRHSVAVCPKGVFVEPEYSFVLGLYKDEA
jgi:hypothetical protein